MLLSTVPANFLPYLSTMHRGVFPRIVFFLNGNNVWALPFINNYFFRIFSVLQFKFSFPFVRCCCSCCGLFPFCSCSAAYCCCCCCCCSSCCCCSGPPSCFFLLRAALAAPLPRAAPSCSAAAAGPGCRTIVCSPVLPSPGLKLLATLPLTLVNQQLSLLVRTCLTRQGQDRTAWQHP